MEPDNWQLLYQHLTSILERNIQQEDSVHLALQLVSELQSHSISTKIGSLLLQQEETYLTNHQEELT